MSMKRLLTSVAFVLCSLLTFAQFSGSGSGTENDPYLILNPIQLNQMRNFLNKSGVYFKLMANIDLTEFLEDENPTQGWQPVGNSSSAAFKGVLDGNGKKISGLWINRSNNDYVGLFGYTDGANVKNLTLEADVIQGGNYTGGFSGNSQSTTISGCSFFGTISGISCVGGYIGNTGDNVTLSNNIVSVTIEASGDNVGGFIGKNDAGNNFSMTNCKSTNSSVSGTGSVGGACGYVTGSHSSTNSLDNCYIYSDVTGNNNIGGICGNCISNCRTLNLSSCGFVGKVSANASYAGGLLGHIEINGTTNGSCTQNIKNCFVVGDVIATNDYVGGLIGYEQGQYYYRGPYYKFTNITHSYFSGSVSGGNNVGGLIGWKGFGIVSYCYASGSVVGTSNVGGLLGYSGKGNGGTNASTVKKSVAILSRITASSDNIGRIVGKNEGTIAAVGSTEENKSYNRTLVVLKGVTQDVNDDLLNGTGVSATTLKLKATYVAMGWDFTDVWAIQETECYPYMQTQTAPPVITSTLISNATSISGKCVDGGTVTLDLDGEQQQTTGTNHTFSFTTNPLQAGHTVRIFAKANGKEQSYYTNQMVAYPGKGTEADPYLIYTADDLTGVYRKGYYKLMNNIDLTDWINNNSPTEGWLGIGRDGSEMSQFDGNGFKITGLWSNSTRDYMGLFSMFANGTIKNLTVETAEGKQVKGGDCTGILIGRNVNGTITNCQVIGNVTGTANVGGIVGMSQSCQMNNLTFSGNVTSSTESAHLGGIVGSSTDETIKQCLVIDGNVNASGSTASVGGVAGLTNSTIEQCQTSGVLTAIGATSQVGGIVGTLNLGGSVIDCKSSEELHSPYAAAGIVSYNYGTVNHCFADGDIYSNNYGAGVVGYNDGEAATVSNCVAANNKIDVTYESQQVQQGGGYGQRILGGIKNNAPAPETEDNYALKTMQVSVNDVAQRVYDDIMNGTAKTLTQLKTQSVYSELGWDFANTWYLNSTTGFPDLKINVDKQSQTLDFAEIPAMQYGDETYQLPEKTNEGLTLTWTIGDSRVASINGNVLTIHKAGTTSVTATQNGNSDYKAFEKAFALTVAKVPLTITAQSISKLLGDENPEFTLKYEGFVLGEDESVLTIPPTVQTDATADSPAGTYDIVVYGAEATNYDITCVNGVLTILDEEALNNTLTMSNVTLKANNTVETEILFNNTWTDITAYQFDIVLPTGVSLAKNSKGKYIVTKTDRYEDQSQSLTVSKTGDNTYRIVSFSLTKGVIEDNEGAILTLSLQVADGIADGVYEGQLTDIVVTAVDGTQRKLASTYFNIEVKNIIPGDANGDGEVNVTDIVEIVNYIMQTPTAQFVEQASDLNNDGEINVTDIVFVVSIIMEEGRNEVAPRVHTTNETTDNDYLTLSQNGQTLSLNLDNQAEYVACQFNVRLAEGQTLESVIANSDRADSHHVICTDMGNNLYKVIIYSLSNETFIGNHGAVADLLVNGKGIVEVDDILFVTSRHEEKWFDALSGLTTGITDIASDESFDIYSVDGTTVRTHTNNLRSLGKGVYIINGKKQLIK